MSVAQPAPEMPFRLFSLPPELRDWVYDSLDVGEQRIESTEVSASSVVGYVENRLQTSCLLVSRDFSREYRDRRARRQTLVFKDERLFADFCIPHAAASVPEALTTVQRCDFILVVFEGGSDLRNHPAWIRDTLIHLSKVQRAHLTTYLQLSEPNKMKMRDFLRATPDLESNLADLTTIGGVETMALWTANDCGEQFQNLDQVLASDCRLLGDYTKGHGWTEVE